MLHRSLALLLALASAAAACSEVVVEASSSAGSSTSSSGSGGAGGSTSCPVGTIACGDMPCVDTSTDPTNCGACGHSCQGGLCVASTCQPLSLTSAETPWEIALDAANVYWVDARGSVGKVPLGGGPSQMLYEVPIANPTTTQGLGVAVDATSIYWTIGTNSYNPDPLAGWVYKIGIGGGAATLLADEQSGVSRIAEHGGEVYWSRKGAVNGIYGCAKDGQSPAKNVSPATNPSGLTTDADHLYWVEVNGHLEAKPFAGGKAVALAPSGDGAVAVDAAFAYIADYSHDTVTKVPLAGGPPVTLATGLDKPVDVAVDGSWVYVAVWNPDGNSNDPNDTVLKIAKEGGAPIVIAAQQAFVTAIAVDATSIYWAVSGGIMKLAK